MRVFGNTFFFDSSKAVRELGYVCAPLPRMLGECASWYRRHGYLGAPAVNEPVVPVPFQEESASWIPER